MAQTLDPGGQQIGIKLSIFWQMKHSILALNLTIKLEILGLKIGKLKKK